MPSHTKFRICSLKNYQISKSTNIGQGLLESPCSDTFNITNIQLPKPVLFVKTAVAFCMGNQGKALAFLLFGKCLKSLYYKKTADPLALTIRHHAQQFKIKASNANSLSFFTTFPEDFLKD